MTTGGIAALLAALWFAFVEGLAQFYPSHQTWRRMRRLRGRFFVRRLRERLEEGSRTSTPQWIAVGLAALVAAWVTAALTSFSRHWYQVMLDVLPYVFVASAVLRIPSAMRKAAGRMKDYERDAGEDPDRPLEDSLDRDDGGPTAMAL